MQWRNGSRLIQLSILATTLGLAACDGGGDDDSGNDDPGAVQSRDVQVRFDGVVDDQPFQCGAMFSGVGTGVANTMKVTDFRIYVSDVTLKREGGEEVPLALTQDGIWQYEDLALLDFEDGCGTGTAELRNVVEGTVEGDGSESYTGVCFTLGVPFEMNHLDNALAPSPLNVTGMFWNWQGGYKFVRIDGKGDPDNLAVGYNVHLGSTGCVSKGGTSAPELECAYPNTTRICLDDFDTGTDFVGVMLKTILADSDVTVATPNTPPGCMSGNFDPECIEIMPKFGFNFVFDDGQNAPQGYPAEPQKFFRKMTTSQ